MREIKGLLKPFEIRPEKTGYLVRGHIQSAKLARLVYFSQYTFKKKTQATLQARLESCKISAPQKKRRKQSTRYSVHGLHEYKGKFNPQVVRGVLNIFDVEEESKLLDPFCGSGTSLIEGVYANMKTVGCDANPFAVYVSRAKLQALTTPVTELRQALEDSLSYLATAEDCRLEESEPRRNEYLSRWFDTEILEVIEHLRASIITVAGPNSKILLALASDLLRDYSQQDPADLRIRRRKTATPDQAFVKAFEVKASRFVDNLKASQKITGLTEASAYAYQCDNRVLETAAIEWQHKPLYDVAITSPPYATALPYIDTQRLSLVWLGLLQQEELKQLEGFLTGSREFLLKDKKRTWDKRLESNSDLLPEEAHRYCMRLCNALSPTDGFRRQAVPSLLYRYLTKMQATFRSVFQVLRAGSPYALVIGHNRTTLGGTDFNINTPHLLCIVAQNCGWTREESIPLETYQRYGMHKNNAVKSETLLILRK